MCQTCPTRLVTVPALETQVTTNSNLILESQLSTQILYHRAISLEAGRDS
jgi:hypothetical protein